MNTHTDGTSRRGVHFAGEVFEALGFAFREQKESDFGIDAHIELRSGTLGSGQLIGLQIKSGESYFRERTQDGWWLRIDQKHSDYWLAHSLPVVVVVVDVESRLVFWELVSKESVEKTDKGAKIQFRRDQPIDEEFWRSLSTKLKEQTLGRPAAAGGGCRVFLGRGVSGIVSWHAFASRLIDDLVKVECLTSWDIFVDVRTSIEDEDLTDRDEWGELAEDLVSIEVDVNGRSAWYRVSATEVMAMDRLSAASAADAIIDHLMVADGLFDDDLDDDG